MMSDVESRLRSHVEAFVNQLDMLVRQQALEAVADVLGGAPRASEKVAKAPSAASPRAAKPAPSRPTRPAKRRAGEKRRPEELAQLTDQLLAHIKSNAGQGVEQIARSLNASTKELTLPVRKLLDARKIAAKGQKRATKYFPR